MFSVCPLLTILGFLFGRTAAMRACYVLLFLGFCLYFAAVAVVLAALFEHYSASGYYVFNVAHNYLKVKK